MVIKKKAADIHHLLQEKRTDNVQIGFVPTMGALHEGHCSLIRMSNRENEVTVVSLFVNPTQFEDPEDFKKYPRVTGRDLDVLKREQVDMVFVPETEEVYPAHFRDKYLFDFGALEHVMEGAYRTGHFKGVAQVVSRLLHIVNPHVLYLGQKDYQQYLVIRKLIDQYLDIPVRLRMAPIVREKDGLAMSSRNVHLTKKQRQDATILYKVLKKVKEEAGQTPLDQLKDWARQELQNNPSVLEVDYFEFVDAKNLNSIDGTTNARHIIACTAVRMQGVRLIDNMIVKGSRSELE